MYVTVCVLFKQCFVVDICVYFFLILVVISQLFSFLFNFFVCLFLFCFIAAAAAF